MRIIFSILFIVIVGNSFGQKYIPDAVSISYFGETITHPGIRLGVSYYRPFEDKIKTKKNTTKTISRSLAFKPGVGFFHHKAYQNSFFLLPEVSLERKNEEGGLFGVGIGVGYMHTRIPNVYGLNEGGEIVKRPTGNHYAVGNIHVLFGKEFSLMNGIQTTWFIKPMYMHAIPNTAVGTGYFILETGLSFKFPS